MDILRKTYPDLEEEKMIDRFYVVDAYIPSKNLCVEIHGPLHYAYNDRENLKTLVKQKIINELGYNIVGVNALRMLSVKNLRDSETAQRYLDH